VGSLFFSFSFIFSISSGDKPLLSNCASTLFISGSLAANGSAPFGFAGSNNFGFICVIESAFLSINLLTSLSKVEFLFDNYSSD